MTSLLTITIVLAGLISMPCNDTLGVNVTISVSPSACPTITPTPTPTPTPCAVFYPGDPLYDTTGTRIYAGGAGFLEESGVIYWYGEAQKDTTYALSPGFNLFTSNDDMRSWVGHGMVFSGTNVTGQSFPQPYRLERPKVLKNQSTSKYVMAFHLDTYNFGIRAVGVATADTPYGPFAYVGTYNIGMWSYDIALYQEASVAFLVSDSEDGTGRRIRIWKLTADYLGIDSFVTTGPLVEGHFLWKDGGTYYILGSQHTGWSPNQVQFFSTPALYGAVWTALPDPTGGSPNTFNTQPTYILRRPNQYVYVGDRWNYAGNNADLQNMMTVFLPMNSTNYSFTFVNPWTLLC